MSTQTQLVKDSLFPRTVSSETGIWCELSEGIDPSQWVYLCRYLGRLDPNHFQKIQKKILENPDTVMNRMKRIFCFNQDEAASFPLVFTGATGLRSECG